MDGRVTIIGLGCVGASIGLALREHVPELEVVGHDAEPEHARRAARMGAVSRTDWNLPAACEGARLIILALPLPAVRETLEVLGPHLEEGCVVTDTATLKVPVLEWARKHLPAGIRFISGTPFPGPAAEGTLPVGTEAARADLFEDGFYCITPAHDTDPGAVTALLDLIRVLGARPLFLEPLEFDGLQAGVGDLPALIATALLRATVGSPGWMDMRKVAGAGFVAATEPAASDPTALRTAALLNRENLLRRLDMFLAELDRIRQWLVDQDEEALEAAYEGAAAGRTRWLEDRAAGTWGELPEVGEVPSAADQFGQLLFGGLFRRRPPREER